MNEDQFSGVDSSLAQDLVQDQQRLLERRFVIKRLVGTSGVSAAQLAQGQTPVKSFLLIECAGQVKVLTGKDIVNMGGLYAEGDLSITTQMPVFGPNNRVGTQADDMTMDGHDYEMRGLQFPVPMAGGVTFTRSTWRHKS